MTGSFWQNQLQERLRAIQGEGLYRSRRTYQGRQGVVLNLEGRSLINFSSNDYLGLASDPRIERALIRGAEYFGVGSGASHLICGHSIAHHALEEELAAFLGRERALLFSTGYMANLGVLSALMGRRDVIHEDRLNHASLLDGARLTGAILKRYPHRGLPDVTGGSSQAMIATDGVFSMDGDLMDGAELSRISAEKDAIFMVDDAHGLGVLGGSGAGILELQGLGQAEVPILMGTLGKAFGTFGAFVSGSEGLIEYLIQKARTYIYTTAMPPAVAEATRTALMLVREEGWRREHLRSLVKRFQSGAQQLGLRLGVSETPIQPILVGDSVLAMKAQAQLRELGFLVVAIRPPTVPAGTARLRCTLTAGHQEEDVDRLLMALAQCPSLREGVESS